MIDLHRGENDVPSVPPSSISLFPSNTVARSSLSLFFGTNIADAAAELFLFLPLFFVCLGLPDSSVSSLPYSLNELNSESAPAPLVGLLDISPLTTGGPIDAGAEAEVFSAIAAANESRRSISCLLSSLRLRFLARRMAGVSSSSIMIVPLAPSTILRASSIDKSSGGGYLDEDTGADVGGENVVLVGFSTRVLGPGDGSTGVSGGALISGPGSIS